MKTRRNIKKNDISNQYNQIYIKCKFCDNNIIMCNIVTILLHSNHKNVYQ